MTDLDLTKLREIAEAATPGPWEAGMTTFGDPRDGATHACVRVEGAHWTDHLAVGEGCAEADLNMAHIAAFDPPTVIALIDEIGRLHNASEFEQRARLQFAALGVPVDEQDEWFRRIAVPAAAGLTLNEFMQLVRAFLSGVSLVDVGGEFDD